MKKIRILQHERYGLGNFINMTPSIKWLYEKNNEKVDVYFSTDYVKECFLKSPYINILNNSTGTFDFSSNMVNKEIEDYKYIFNKITGQNWSSNYHTFIDEQPEFKKIPYEYVLILNGLGGFEFSDKPNWMGKKELNEEVFKVVKNNINIPLIFTGSIKDLKRTSWSHKYCNLTEVGDIRKSLSLIQNAKLIISNDTGLAHAAGAMNKNILILWKDTPFIKNQNPGLNTKYCHKKDWSNCIVEFLNQSILI